MFYNSLHKNIANNDQIIIDLYSLNVLIKLHFCKTPQRQDSLTGGTGLYMNYSIIFTEISFYPDSVTNN